MSTRILILVSVFTALLLRPLAAEQPNFLFICTDDLRPMLGCYGAEWMHTPNIDALAERGMVFERAYCQAAQCGPSRVSFMTGLRPDTTKIFSLRDHFKYAKSEHGDSLTMARHLRAHGYTTQAFGKIFHDLRDDPASWSIPASPGREGEMLEIFAAAGEETIVADREDCPAWQSPDVADETFYAGRMTTQARAAMGELQQAGEPFFLAVGFRRPHLPFVAPKRYYDLYSDSDAAYLLPENADPPAGAPLIGYYNSTNYAPLPGKKSRWPVPPPLRPENRDEALAFAGYELRSYRRVPVKGVFEEATVRQLRRAYMACVSYVDAQVGRLLAGLREQGLEDDTVVILLSDHGWHLGEHGTWSKMTNYEWATRVPLIIAVPDESFAPGKSRALVELVDLYPTVSELAGVAVPEHLEGHSLVPILQPSAHSWKGAAFSQFPRKQGPTGKTVRTDRYRYIEWRDAKSGEIVAQELYDHSVDPGELRNLAGAAEATEILGELSGLLH